MEILEGTAADHETRISDIEVDVNGIYTYVVYETVLLSVMSIYQSVGLQGVPSEQV